MTLSVWFVFGVTGINTSVVDFGSDYLVILSIESQANSSGDNVHNSDDEGVYVGASFRADDNALLGFPGEFQHLHFLLVGVCANESTIPIKGDGVGSGSGWGKPLTRAT